MEFKAIRTATRSFIIIGVLFFAASSYLLINDYCVSSRGVLAKGRVIDFDIYESTNDHGGSTKDYSPVFQYEFEGQTYVYQSTISSSSQGYQLNENVDILINPKDPNNIIVNTFAERWRNPALLIFFSICSLIIANVANRYGK